MLKRGLRISLLLIPLALCAAPLITCGFVVIDPFVRESQLKQSLQIIAGAQHLFEETTQFSGSFQQRSLFYWSPQPLAEVQRFYQDFATPFATVDGTDSSWLIAAWRNSITIDDPIRPIALPSDICDYHQPYRCISLILLDANGSVRPFWNEEREALPESGTLIIFTYYVPDIG
ncbi:MAG: hypothetical protein J0M07_23850 [Anaerolineae bacterium]|nr:hypothetical protein [Anaerolineae bacterium]